MKVAWLVSNVKTANPEELLTTELASSRMRAGVSIAAFRTAQHDVLPLNLVGSAALPDIAFMSKYVHDSGANLYLHDGGARWDFWTDLVFRIKASGGKLVVDYTDNHLAGDDIRTKWYRHILPQVDGVVVPSDKMASNARGYWDGPMWLIPEPIEVPILPPRQGGSGPIEAIWFGHNSNLPYLYRFIQQEMHHCPPMNVRVLTNFLDTNVLKAVIAKGPKSARFSVGKWTVASMLELAQQCQVALIPSDRSDPRKNGASANRVITALALGLVPVAEMIDSYAPFSAYCLNISNRNDLSELTQSLPMRQARVRDAQGAVVPRFTVDQVGPQWVRVAEELTATT